MAKYRVTWKETTACTAIIEADSQEEAEQAVYSDNGGADTNPEFIEIQDGSVSAVAEPVDVANKPFVQLSGEDGNAFAIIGRCSKALKNAGLTVEADSFREKCFAATSYDEVLQLAMRYCDVA